MQNTLMKIGGTMETEKVGAIPEQALAGYIRWVLFLLALVALFVGAGGGAGVSYALARIFEAWKFWMQVLPGAGWATIIALFALWLSMDNQRRFLFFSRPRPQ